MEYRNLFLMAGLSFISMFILMYLMVNTYSNVYMNLNQFYMAGIMTMPMIIIELLVMRSMHINKRINKKLNALIVVFSLALFIVLIIFVRKQTAIYDQEFLRSMIPHHAAAILMCKNAQLEDPQIKELCRNIAKNQQAEIDFMKTKLEMLKNNKSLKHRNLYE